ncbi:MAG: hypothetical protein KDB80_07560 [Planctomycetes bacterium]|nr:hypothetical protein [Planctomycetota bacterium]
MTLGLRSSRSAAIAALTLTSLAGAQAHLTVPGQYPEISAAVQAAAPGDVIQVDWRQQPYQPIVIDKTITIVGRALEHFAPTIAVAQGIGIDCQLQPGERATLSRVDVIPVTGASQTTGVRVQGGFATLEDCRIRGGVDASGTGNLAAVDLIDTDVSVAFCRFQEGSGAVALRATRSNVGVTDSRMIGSSFVVGDAVHLVDSTLHAAECLIAGGEDFTGGPGAVAIRLQGSSRGYLVDCGVSGGTGQPGGIAIVNTTGTPVELGRTSIGGGTTLSTFTSVAASTGPVVTNNALLGLLWSEPPYRRGTLQRGQGFGVHGRAAPGTVVLMLVGLAPTKTSKPFTRQPAMDLGEVLVGIPRLADANGYATFTASVPDVPAA